MNSLRGSGKAVGFVFGLATEETAGYFFGDGVRKIRTGQTRSLIISRQYAACPRVTVLFARVFVAEFNYANLN